jgi:acyl-CoA thioester hydrolase
VTPSSGVVEGGVHRFDVRVYYEDTDFGGIVYYANYLRFIERARTEMLRLMGQQHSALKDATGVVWTVRRCAVEYLKPARLDDILQVDTRVLYVGGASVDLAQVVRRGDTVLVTTKLTIACMSAEGKPVRLPHKTRDSFAALVADENGSR